MKGLDPSSGTKMIPRASVVLFLRAIQGPSFPSSKPTRYRGDGGQDLAYVGGHGQCVWFLSDEEESFGVREAHPKEQNASERCSYST
jgi:hypothetical protein